MTPTPPFFLGRGACHTVHEVRTYACLEIICDLYSGHFTLSIIRWVSRGELKILYAGHRARNAVSRATREFDREDGRRAIKTQLSARRFSGVLVTLAMAAIDLASQLP